jgi:hypothetical protein
LALQFLLELCEKDRCEFATAVISAAVPADEDEYLVDSASACELAL